MKNRTHNTTKEERCRKFGIIFQDIAETGNNPTKGVETD